MQDLIGSSHAAEDMAGAGGSIPDLLFESVSSGNAPASSGVHLHAAFQLSVLAGEAASFSGVGTI